MKDLIVTAQDMNAIDFMNGSSSGTERVYGLKGALSKYNSFINNEYTYIRDLQTQIMEFLVEKYEYEGLPKGLDKLKIEKKLAENGSAAILKVSDTYFCMKYTTVEFDIYDQPVKILINEPKSSLNGKEYNIQDGDVFIIRDNILMTSKYTSMFKYLNILITIYKQFIKNIIRSAPKGILNTKNGKFITSEEDPNADSLEYIFNNDERTFFSYINKEMKDYEIANENEEDIFIPIELTDMSDSLIKQYSFIKEQIKEFLGSENNTLQNKKERLITGEIEKQGLAVSTRQHGLSIRVIDWEPINEKFSLNVEIKITVDKMEDVEEEQETGGEDV